MRAPRQSGLTRHAPGLAEFEAMAAHTVEALPEPFRAAAAGVVLVVEDFPSEELLDEMEIDDPFDLTGLYRGVPLTQKSVIDQPHGPDMVFVFRRPVLEEWIERGNVTLEALVAHVVVHEFAHHFGWSDEDIAAIDRWWE